MATMDVARQVQLKPECGDYEKWSFDGVGVGGCLF